MSKLRRKTDPTRIVDLKPADYIAAARTAPRRSRRENQAIELHERGASMEFIQRATGLHPMQIWAVLGLSRDTAAGEKAFQDAVSLHHHMRHVFDPES